MLKKIRNIVKLIKYAGKAGKTLLFFSVIKTMLTQLIDCAITILIPVLVIRAYENTAYGQLISVVCAFFIISFVCLFVVDKIDNVYICSKYAQISKKIITTIFRKITDSDIGRFDDAVFYEQHILNMNNIEEKVFEAISNVSMLLSCFFIFLLNMSLIATTSGKKWIFVGVSLLITAVIQFFQTRFNLEYQKKAVSLNRRAEVLGQFFMGYDYAKEIKTPKRSNMLFEQVLEEKQKALALYYQSRPQFIGYTFGRLFVSTFWLRVLFLIYLTFRCLVYREYSYAGILVAYNASINLYGILNNIIATVSKYDDISLYAEHYMEIMNYENEIISGNKILDCFESLEFKDVCFQYPGTDKVILDHVSFKIERGQKVALVGRNGNGKTSLIKLILRLYEPISGEIFVNSVNIKEYEINSYRHFWGVVFQDASMFNGSIKENICFEHEPACELEVVLKNVDMLEKINKLENKTQTEYGVDIFEKGIVFSGGEQQRILVARALAKNADMIIMDEPTSHIDPAADISFSSMIFNDLPGKTILYITHRLLSTRLADLVIVLNGVGTVEIGTHDMLMAQSQLYRQLYQAQERNYADCN